MASTDFVYQINDTEKLSQYLQTMGLILLVEREDKLGDSAKHLSRRAMSQVFRQKQDIFKNWKMKGLLRECTTRTVERSIVLQSTGTR